jgi:hypothetical protein
MIEITEKIAAKVLATVDAGLISGLGKPKPGEMCIEAAVCYALGEPHGDEPACVSKALRAFKIRLNDSDWSNRHARAMGLRRLALAQLGSAGSLDEVLFVTRLAILAKKWAHAGSCAARGAATRCAVAAAIYAATADDAAARAADPTRADAAAADAADAAIYAARAAASAAARAARATADDAARNKSLANAAEDVVQLLIEMNAPGTKWLALAPLNS